MDETERHPGNSEYYALDQHVLAVAVEGQVGDWAAYIGAVPGHCHRVEYESVRKSGAKLPYKIARVIFPYWDENLVWRV